MSIPRSTYVFLVIGLLAASQSGNIIRLGEAHAVAIAFWRLILATLLLAPLAGRDLGLLRRLSRLDATLVLLAGVTLALHFFAWIAAVQWTTVANAAIFFSINPVLTGAAAFLIFRERIGVKLVISILLGLTGITLIGWQDFRLAPEHLAGDVSALVCSALFTLYFLLGKRLRRALPTTVYVTAVYGVAAGTALICMPLLDLPLLDYDGQTWLCFGLMALVPTMLGHTSINNALKYIDASRISVATLSEPLLAGLVAYLAWGESISALVVLGYLLISSSVVVLVLDRQSG